MSEILPYSQILKMLTDLVDKKAVGVLSIHSDDNHAITIALESGSIHAIYFGANRGLKAISMISGISGGSCRFETSDLVGGSQELPPTNEILNLLGGSDTVSEPVPKPTSSAVDEGTINNEIKTVLCKELKDLLTEYMGPIAEIVFDDTADKVGDFCATPQLARALINKLSDEIEETDEADRFRKKAHEVLKKLLKN